VCFGILYPQPNLSIDSVYFTGQRQMLARLDGTYGVDETQQDWFTTYYGGTASSAPARYPPRPSARARSSPRSRRRPCGGPCRRRAVRRLADPDRFLQREPRPSDGVVFDTSCEATTGIGHVAGLTMVTGTTT